MSFEQALEALSRDEAFKATIYAMNTLLIHRGVYTRQEFETLFVEWAQKELGRKGRREQSTPSIPAYR